jgi:hypothetical protein
MPPLISISSQGSVEIETFNLPRRNPLITENNGLWMH